MSRPSVPGDVAITLRNLRIVYRDRRAETVAVENFGLEVRRGELVSVLGPSGCGKSSVLNAIGGFVSPFAGSVTFHPPFDHLEPGDIAVVFQDHGLFPWLTALENAALRLKFRGVSKAVRDGQAAEMLNRVGLSSDVGKFPHELSGGMKQRVAIARAMLGNPRMLLLDEPFGALDSLTRFQMQELLVSLLDGNDVPVVLVTHDVAEAVFLSDRIAIMTPAPGSLRTVMEVNHAGGRDRDFLKSAAFDSLRRQILDLLL